ncbi:MAG: hypothetical protein JSW40_04020 [Candidatus Omnitrophota bacterium]|nr:MAG: hypothetical protein JSW40_04020 [Candidatus Omnitrophota bacterium]
MKAFKITIRADKYPMDYVVQASDWSPAISRAVREWKKRFKGSRTIKLSITAVKAEIVLQANGEEK